jgi:ankyrin repeat protein
MTRNVDNTWTYDALQRGDTAAIRAKLRQDKTYVHERDFVGRTPLLNAICCDELELVHLLLEHGADPNVAVDDGYTCLLTALDSLSAETDRSTPIVAALIGAGADIHAIGMNGWTPLHMAAARGNAAACRLLIDAGADVNRRTDIDSLDTPLMVAASLGRPETVRLLLEHGADPSLRDALHNKTPLELAEAATRGPDPSVVDYLTREGKALLKKTVDTSLDGLDVPADELAAWKELMRNIDPAQGYIDSCTSLAKKGNHAEVIRILTEQGC